MKESAKKYIEMDVVNWDYVFLALFTYPILLFMGLAAFFFNFIRYNLKLLFYLIVSIIPIANSSLASDSANDINFWEMFDEFEFTMDNIKSTKKFEVKMSNSNFNNYTPQGVSDKGKTCRRKTTRKRIRR